MDELPRFLTQNKNNLNLKWRDMHSTRPNRRARNKAPVSYSDDKPREESNRQTTLPTPPNKAGKQNNDSESNESDPNSEKDDTKSSGSVFSRKGILRRL